MTSWCGKALLLKVSCFDELDLRILDLSDNVIPFLNAEFPGLSVATEFTFWGTKPHNDNCNGGSSDKIGIDADQDVIASANHDFEREGVDSGSSSDVTLYVNLVHESVGILHAFPGQPDYAGEFALHFHLRRSTIDKLTEAHHPLLEDAVCVVDDVAELSARARNFANRRFVGDACPGDLLLQYYHNNRLLPLRPEESDSAGPADSLRHWVALRLRVRSCRWVLAGLAESQAADCDRRSAERHPRTRNGLVNRLLRKLCPDYPAPRLSSSAAEAPSRLLTLSPTTQPLPPPLPRRRLLPVLPPPQLLQQPPNGDSADENDAKDENDDAEDESEDNGEDEETDNWRQAASGNSPVLLVGEPGEGKSCVLASVACQLLRWLRGRRREPSGPAVSGAVLIYHSPDADYRSGDVRWLLIRLLAELLDGVDWSAAATAAASASAPSGCPLTPPLPPELLAYQAPFCSDLLREDAPVSRLSDAVAFLLEFSGPRRPLLLILPGCDRLRGEPGAARLLNWLPSNLAAFARVLMSCPPDCEPAKTLRSRDDVGVPSGSGAVGAGGGCIDCELVLPLCEPERRLIVAAASADAAGPQPPLSAAEVARLARSSDQAMFLQLSAVRSRRRHCLSVCDSLSELCRSVVVDAVADLPEADGDADGNSAMALAEALLSLLANSAHGGLFESEAVGLLSSGPLIAPGGPFAEKDGVEPSEKASIADAAELMTGSARLGWSQRRWTGVLSALAPLLTLPAPQSLEPDRWLAFRHPALRKAARSLYQASGQFWLSRLADHFERPELCGLDRCLDEFPPAALASGALGRLEDFLCRWDVLETFQQCDAPEPSDRLLRLWRDAAQCGDYGSMAERYCGLLEAAGSSACCLHRHLLICRVLLLAGHYRRCLEAAKSAYKLAKAAGLPQPITADLCGLMFHLYDDRLKLSDFVTSDQKPTLRRAIKFAEAAIGVYSRMRRESGRRRLAVLQMRLGFALDSWRACGGGHAWLTPEQAVGKALSLVQAASDAFARQLDRQLASEAAMTQGVLAKRGSDRQLRLYKAALRLARLLFGDCHRLVGRLYINIGIAYEDKSCFLRAYMYFRRWAEVIQLVYGPDHPKTCRAGSVLLEPRYRRAALYLRHLHSSEVGPEQEAEFSQRELQEDEDDQAQSAGGSYSFSSLSNSDHQAAADEDDFVLLDEDQLADLPGGSAAAGSASAMAEDDGADEVVSDMLATLTLRD